MKYLHAILFLVFLNDLIRPQTYARFGIHTTVYKYHAKNNTFYLIIAKNDVVATNRQKSKKGLKVGAEDVFFVFIAVTCCESYIYAGTYRHPSLLHIKTKNQKHDVEFYTPKSDGFRKVPI